MTDGTAKAWIDALRLRTLPLSVSGVVAAAGIAGCYHVFSPLVFLLMLIMVILLQVDSNFADEYGDLSHGADNDDRLGPVRGLQRGDITAPQMKRAIVACSALAVLFALVLLAVCLLPDHPLILVAFLVLAGLCVCAAIFYTVGDHAYGYHALGDISCFVFFGLVAVIGGFFLYTAHAGVPTFVPVSILPAISVGCLACGVLNLNNMRDIHTDREAGKTTLVVKLGAQRARFYHVLLIALGMAGFLSFGLLVGKTNPLAFVFVVPYIPLAKQLMGVLAVDEPSAYDRFMKPLSMTTFVTTVLFALCMALL